MPRQKRDARIYELARRGAEARLRDLIHEAQLLMGLFPHLGDSIDKDELPVLFILRKGRDRAAVKTRGRRKMSPAERKAVSERMKKYWAQKKAKK